MAKKSFVLDTNVLLHNPMALTSFADNEVVIPIDVIEELDRFKARDDTLGLNARAVVRQLDALRRQGSLSQGVPIPQTGGTLRVDLQADGAVPPGFKPDRSDNRIIGVAYRLFRAGVPTVFVSKDMNARIKSDALGIRTMDFEKEKVDFENLYAGWVRRTAAAGDVEGFRRTGALALTALGEAAGSLIPNEFVELVADGGKAKAGELGRVSPDGRSITALRFEPRIKPYNIQARNLQQRMALELLLDDAVELVTLVGQAGTGKTLLALAAGLHRVVKEEAFERMLVTRPVVPLGRDIGYLPGSKEAKLSTWMQPIFDNLAFLMHQEAGPKRASADRRINELLSSQQLELEAMTYIRGRSIPNQYILVDEAQNLTPHEVKTIVSRAGEGSKVVLTGDAYQIDNPYLDSASNGLTYSAERFRGQPLAGHVTLERSERSTLASLAAELL
jgi:PhoH-like ATPase